MKARTTFWILPLSAEIKDLISHINKSKLIKVKIHLILRLLLYVSKRAMIGTYPSAPKRREREKERKREMEKRKIEMEDRERLRWRI